MNAFKLNQLDITLPERWGHIGEGLKILKDRKEEIVVALNKSHPNRCRSCEGRAVDLRVWCGCTPEESVNGLWVNPLDLTSHLTEDERVEISPSHSDAELPQELQDLLMINELISDEEWRLHEVEEREEERRLHDAEVEECYASEMVEWTGEAYMP